MSFGPLVSADWLAAHLRAVRVVDVRWYLDGRSGRAAYEAGHLPGAVWLDLDTELSDPASEAAGRHPLPSPKRFAAALGRVGIAAGTPVVAYDDAGGSIAARLWWMLHVLGEPAAVLDGGLAAWSAPSAPLTLDRSAGASELAPPRSIAWPGSLTTEVPSYSPVRREPVEWPVDRFVTADDVVRSSAAIFDARTAERYAHGDPEIDPRPGHVPGALSAPWAGNLGVDGKFLAPDALRQRFPVEDAIAYCGSGVTACHDLLAMELAGVAHTALYPGSWSQWGADPDRPAEQGLAP